MALDPVQLAISTVTLSAPLALAAIAGYMSERSGVINIALEGKMLTAAFACFAASTYLGAVGGIFVALVVGILFSLLHWYATQKLKIDPIISGMALNLMAVGATNFGKELLPPDPIADGKTLPLQLFYVLAFAVPFAVMVWSAKTRAGLRLRAVGSDPDKARLVGVNPLSVRFGALIITGVLTGLAGSLLVTETRNFTDGMTAGRGYIALAALILGGWRPVPALLATILFGFASAVQIQLKGTELAGANIPSGVWSMLPYLVTLIALAGFVGKQRTPGGLGKV